MGTMVESFAKTLELLTSIVVSGAEGTYKKVRPLAPLYLKSLVITALVLLTLVPALASAKMVTGEVEFAYAAAFIAIIFTLVLGLLWSPLGIIIGMLTGSTPNPVTGGERYVKFVATILFAELMISGYIIRVPTHQNLEAVPLLIISAAAVGMGTFVWGGWLSGRFYVAIATVIMFLTTLSFFMPQTFAIMGEKVSGLDKELASAVRLADQQAASQQTAAAQTVGGRTLSFAINPTSWTDCHLPPNQTIKRWGAAGGFEMAFAIPLANGSVRADTVRIATGTSGPLHLPYNIFRARGTSGALFFELE